MAEAAMLPATSPPDSQINNTDYIPMIFVLIVLAVFLLALLHIMGSLRRTTSHKLIHAIVSVTYMISYTVVSYTLGLMKSSMYSIDMFPVWAVCLLLLLGSTDSLAVRSLNEHHNLKSILFRIFIQLGAVLAIVISFGSGYMLGPLCAILVIIYRKYQVRASSMKMASKSNLLFSSVKPIADHMQYEHKQMGCPYDPVTLKGYRYIVTGEKYYVKPPTDGQTNNNPNEEKIITIEKVSNSAGSLLSSNSERSLRLKDLCLSMALAKMLNRRFSGFKLVEADDHQTHDFLFGGLLHGVKPYDRAFRVIEVELAFIHDLYYTCYPYLYRKSLIHALYLPVAMVMACSWLTYKLFKHRNNVGLLDNINNTIFIMVVVTFLEIFQLYLHIVSSWFKVELIRTYVTNQQKKYRFFHMTIAPLLRLKGIIRPWQQKLGQYSLLHNCKSSSRISYCFYYMTLCQFDKTNKRLEMGEPIKLSGQVKYAVLQTFKDSNGRLTNGVKSLGKHGVQDCEQLISWACDARDTEATHTILIWHIATTLCKHQHDARVKEGQLRNLSKEDATAIDVASGLSHYCAYLVAFAPDLLPDHSSTSKLVLDESIKEAQKLLAGGKTMKSCYKKLMNMDAVSNGEGVKSVSVIVLGARLAKKLIEDYSEDPAAQWKVLSDFWCEMVLYVAPSDDARAHLEAMAKGGEFVTHLWALLTHGGVLKRDMHSV